MLLQQQLIAANDSHKRCRMPPPRPPPRRPPRAQAQYAAHALQAHGALPPRPPPADPAVTTAIEVLEASARYAWNRK